MNKTIYPCILLTISLLTLPSTSTKAQWRDPAPQINVSGTAEVKVTPDEVDLNVGVETREPDLNTARQKNDAAVAGVLKFLREQGVPQKNVQTGFITVEPDYNDYDSMRGVIRRPQPVSYVIRKDIGIVLTNLVAFDTIMTGLLANGANNVHGIDFRTTELRKYKDQARAMATKAAKEKAEAMTAELGVKIGKPCNISINDWSGWSGWNQNSGGYGGTGANAVQNVSQNAGNTDENGASFSVGEISVTATINVSFLIQ